jgi:hypothetical protein
MEPVAIFLLLIVLICIVLYVSRPFLERRRGQAVENNPELSSLLAERERLLTALQELDFDQSLGKIPVEDYPTQRSALLQKGAEVLRQLDNLTYATAMQSSGKSSDSKSHPASRLSDDDLEDILAKRRYARKDKAAGFCPNCGKPILQSDVFCTSCGKPLK